MLAMRRDALAAVFIHEIECGVNDGQGDLPHRAGVIKIASNGEGLIAAAQAHHVTGCPIITHVESPDDAMHQAELFATQGVDLSRVTLSHCDGNPDIGFHRALLQTGVCLEYDQHFRQLRRGDTSASIALLAALAPEFPAQLTVGMDAARATYWRSYGGEPGLAWLVTELPRLLRDAGLDDTLIARLYLDNPAGAFSFAERHAEAHS